MTLLTRPTSLTYLPVLTAFSLAAVLVALGLVFGYAPIERTMGVVQKIFYFHVPSAIAAYAGFVLCCVGSIAYLLTRNPRWDAWAQAGAEAGVAFCSLVLLSGPLWARKAWGTWWTGEPRLMLTLVVFLIFVAYLLVRNFGGTGEMTRRICAVLGILGVANIPLIRTSVERWRGTHPQVISGEGGGITDEMQVALLASFVAIALLFATLVWLRATVATIAIDVQTARRELARREFRAEDLSSTP